MDTYNLLILLTLLLIIYVVYKRLIRIRNRKNELIRLKRIAGNLNEKEQEQIRQQNVKARARWEKKRTKANRPPLKKRATKWIHNIIAALKNRNAEPKVIHVFADTSNGKIKGTPSGLITNEQIVPEALKERSPPIS